MKENIPQIFNRKLLRKMRDQNIRNIGCENFLSEYAASLLIEKLSTTNFTVSNILNIGFSSQKLEKFLIRKYKDCNITYGHYSTNCLKELKSQNKIVFDEELIPISDNSFDLVISLLNLHHINDLPGTLIQIKKILKDKGVFLAILLGERSFEELKTTCLDVDGEFGTMSPKVAPFIDIKTTGLLLKRTGFYMPIIDNQQLTLEYENMDKLLSDIKNIGESNILSKKSNSLIGKKRLASIKKSYINKFSQNNIIPATIELINITAFKS